MRGTSYMRILSNRANREKESDSNNFLIPFPNSLHKRSMAVNRFVKNRKAKFGSPIEGNPKYSGQMKPKWIFHLTSTEISGISGIMHLSLAFPGVDPWDTPGDLF